MAAEIVQKVIDPKNSAQDVMNIYNKWATKYDSDMQEEQFDGPKVMAQALQSVVANRAARVLDIAAGTGMLGAAVKEAGYSNIDALDPNEAMLGEARKLNVYKNFIVDFLGKNKLNVENDTYDAVIGSGLFVPGHVNEESFDELCRITKPGGYVVIISSDRYKEEQYEGYAQRLSTAIQQYESRGLWKIEKQEYIHYHGPYNACLSYLIIQ